PAKFPLLLAQGADGIAVGLSTKILPHNFNELCQAAIHHLKGRSFKLVPDFATGGLMDASDYQAGKRGGRIKVRARIEVEDKKTLRIREIPYGTTTQAIIDSIIKSNDKGKIRIKKVVDNTAKEVDIEIELPTGISPDVTIDALYAFTNCEVSLAPNACIIYEDKPHFLSVHDILKLNVEETKNLLQWELEIEKEQLEQKWHLASLEKIFIEQRIYRDIEECETWEAVIAAIDQGMHKHVSTPSRINKSASAFSLMRDITEEDILKLTEIKIKRISKFDSFKADEIIHGLEEKLAEVKNHLAHLTDYTIAYFERIKKTYGSDKVRRTELQSFEAIKIKHVAANNVKLYANLKEGFVGMGLKKDTFITDCSDIDDIIAFKKDGSMIISRIEDKKFVGKDILYVAVWKKNEDRRIYHMIYADLTSG
ncbi:MAG: DNA gyrase subunit A, partial [Bacteroidota bacterium]|nr:DNA gyrase subunit A [Bacteroidota bacterium]